MIRVISVRVLCLFHNNSIELQLIHLLLVLLYNSSVPNYCYYWSAVRLLTEFKELLLHCTVHYLKYAPVTSIIGWQFWEPDWVSMTFHGAPSSMYPTAWTGPYLGTVQHQSKKKNIYLDRLWVNTLQFYFI